MPVDESLAQQLRDDVRRALREDIGSGDLTAELIPPDAQACASLITRERTCLAGRPWFDETLRQVDGRIDVHWLHEDGDIVDAGTELCRLAGPARPLLAAERTAINFLQTLSATATATAAYVAAIAGSGCRILDTRKTIPGLRLAQKYAVRCGGGCNHRIGLFDAILIKENHIVSAGGIEAAVRAARQRHPQLPIEIEVESIDELRAALAMAAERILLDNFSLSMLADAVAINRLAPAPSQLEASGGVTLAGVAAIAATGVDFISVGALTKDLRAIDLSMRFTHRADGH